MNEIVKTNREIYEICKVYVKEVLLNVVKLYYTPTYIKEILSKISELCSEMINSLCKLFENWKRFLDFALIFVLVCERK